MKRAWRIIPFALLAAAALVLAAGCSDDPTGDLGGQAADESAGSAGGQGTSAGSAGGSQAIAQNDILDLIKEIDYVNGFNGQPYPTTYWDFSNATLGEDSAGIVAVIPWSVQSPYENFLDYKPYITYTLKQLKARGKVGTSLLSVDLSGSEWDESTGERTQAEEWSSGYRYVTLEIALAEGASGELTEELQSVAIALDSGEREWGRY